MLRLCLILLDVEIVKVHCNKYLLASISIRITVGKFLGISNENKRGVTLN